MRTTATTTSPAPATFPLALRPMPAAVREPAAWFVPGPDPAGWLDEVGRWGVPTADLRLLVLPASAADPTPIGVLVVMPSGTEPRDVRRGQPYGRVVGKLYLPVAAELWPPVGEGELRDLLLFPALVLHPSAGLVGFAEEDVLRVHDLLAAPAERAADLGWAAAGETVRPRIVTVQPQDPPGIEGLLEQGRGDIGSAPPAGLPRAAGESAAAEVARRLGVAPAKVAEAAAMGPIKFVAWVWKQLDARGRGTTQPGVGGGAPGNNWAERLQDWAADRFAELHKSLRDQRAREVERLQKMLADDPDQGLRHAIALRDLPGRGRALPSGRLGTRDVNFSLTSALGGGGQATDGWDIPPDAVERLRKGYLDAANRELRLGRYRRAAYVFAELLGDYAAAANALEQGRHHREAAVLYRDKLNNPARAAACLEQGGLLAEAAAAYEALKQFEQAGDLFARIDRPDEATRCYRAQVDADVARHDLPAAARLLERKLAAADEALALLTAAWPGEDAAGACLRASFDLLGRLARHDEAAARVARLRQDPPPAGLGVVLTEALAAVAAGYPEQRVRSAGADATKVVAARLLPAADRADRRAIAGAVGKLNPEDRLLARDVERFLADRPAARPQPKRPPARPWGAVVVRRFTMDETVDCWQRVAAIDDGFCMCGGASGPGAFVVRGRWIGATQSTHFRIADLGGDPDRLELHPLPGGTRVLLPPPVRAGGQLTLPPSLAFPAALQLVRPSWLPDDVLAIGNNEHGVTWALSADPFGAPIMKAYRSADGRLIASHGLQGVDLPPDPPARLVARHDVVYAAWGSGVLRFIPLVEARVEQAPSPVRGLAVSPPGGPLRVAAACAEGGVLLWHDRRAEPFADGLTSPHVTFTRDGTLVAADRERGRAYRTDAGTLRHARDFDGLGDGVIGLTPTDQPNGFAAFTAAGRVTVYQLPG